MILRRRTAFFLLCLTLLAGAAGEVWGDNYSWDGEAGNDNWTDQINWYNDTTTTNDSGYPQAGDTATIDLAGTYTVSVDAAVTVDSVTMDAANATLSLDNNLTLGAGDFTVTAGSAVAGTAALVFNSGGAQSLNPGGLSIPNVTVRSGSVVSAASAVTVGTVLAIENGVFDASGFALTAGTLLNDDDDGAGDAVLRLQGGEAVSFTTMDTDSGEVVYDGTGGPYTGLAAGDSYYDLSFNAASTWTLDAALQVNGGLSVLAGTLDTGGNGLDVTGPVDVDAALTLGTTSAQFSGASVDFTGGTLNAGTSTVTFDGTTDLTSDNKIFNAVTVAGTGAVTLLDNGDFDGGLTVQDGGSLSAGTRTLDVDGGVSVAGTLGFTDGTLNAGATGDVSVASTGILEATGAGTFTIGNSLSVTDGDLTVGSGGASVGADLTVSAASTVTNNGGITLDSGGTGNHTLTANGVSLGNVEVDDAGQTVSQPGSATVDTLTITNGTYLVDDSGGTAALTVNNSIANEGVLSNDGSNGATVQGGSAGIPVSGAGSLDLTGSLTLGNLDVQQSVAPTAALDLTLNNPVSFVTLDYSGTTGSTLDDAGNPITFTGTGALNLTGCTPTQTGTWIFAGINTELTSDGNTLQDLQLGTGSGGGKLTVAAGPLDLDGELSVMNGGATEWDISSQTVNYAGASLDLSNLDTFTTAGSTVVFDGTTNPLNGGSVAFTDLTVSGSATLGGPLDVDGDLSIGGSGSLSAGVNGINAAGNWTVNSGGAFTAGTGTVTFDGTTSLQSSGIAFNTVNVADGASVTLADALDVDGNLVIGAGASGSLDTGGFGINAAGNWTLSGGATFNHGNGTVTFDGGGTSTILGANTFYNLTCTVNGATLAFDSSQTQTIDTGGTLTVTGASGTANLITLTSDDDTSAWTLLNNGSTSIDYARVRHGNVDDGGSDVTANTSWDETNNDTTPSPAWVFTANTLTWDGSSSTDWGTAANWDEGYVPNSGDEVVIANAGNQPATLGGNRTADILTINASAALDTAGNTLTISSAFTNNGTLYRQGGDSVSRTDNTSGTVHYRAAGGAIQNYNPAGTADYNHLVLDGQAFTLSAELETAGGLDLIGGAELQTGGYDLAVAGDYDGASSGGGTLNAGSGGTLAFDGDVLFGLASQTAGSTVQFTGGAAQAFTPNGQSFGTIQNSNTAAQVSLTGTVTVDQLTVDGSADLLLDDSAGAVSVTVDTGVTNNGAMNHDGTNGVTLQGSSAGIPFTGNDISWAAGAGGFTLGNLDYQRVLAPTADVQLSLNNPVIVDSLDFSSATAATLDDGGSSLTVDTGDLNLTNCTATLTGDLIFTGTAGTPTLTTDGNTLNNLQIGTPSSGGWLTAGDTWDIDGTFAVGTGGSDRELDISSQTVNIASATVDLTNLTAFTETGSTVNFDGGAAQGLTAAGNSLEALEVSGASTHLTVTDALSVASIDFSGGATMTPDGNLTAAGNITGTGDIGGTTAGSGTVTVTGPADIGVDITTADTTINFQGAVTLTDTDTNSVSIDSGPNGGDVDFDTTIDGGGKALILDAGTGSVILGGAVTNLASLSMTGATLKPFDVTTTTGGISFTGPVVLTADTALDTTAAGGSGDITFSSTIDATTAGQEGLAMELAGTASLSLGGTVGATALEYFDLVQAAAYTVDQPITVSGGTTGIGMDINGDAGLTVNAALDSSGGGGPIDLDADGNLDFGAGGDLSSGGGNITVTADSDGDSSGGSTMAAGTAVNSGAGTIGIAAYGDITLGQLTSTFGTSGSEAVSVVSSNGSVLEAGDTGPEITANSGGYVTLEAAGRVGASAAVDVTAALPGAALNLAVTDLRLGGSPSDTALDVTTAGLDLRADSQGGTSTSNLLVHADAATEVVSWNPEAGHDDNVGLVLSAGNLTLPDAAIDVGAGTLRFVSAGDVLDAGNSDLSNNQWTAGALYFQADGVSETLNTDVDTFADVDLLTSGDLQIDNTGGATYTSLQTADGAITVTDDATVTLSSIVSSTDADANDISVTTTDGGNIQVGTVTTGGTAGDVTLTANTSGNQSVVDATSSITADVLTITARDAIGASGTPLNSTAVSADLSTTTNAGGIYLDESDGLTITGASTTDGPVVINAGGLLAAESVDTSSTDADANDITLTTTAGNIQVGTVTTGGTAGDVSLIANTAGNQSVVDATSSITTDVLTITARDAIGASGTPLNSTAVSADLSTTTNVGGIYLDETDGITLTDVDTLNGDIVIANAAGNMVVEDVNETNGGNLVFLDSAAGEINDGGAVAEVVTAGSLRLNAETGITAFNTAAGSLSAETEEGVLEVFNTGNLDVSTVNGQAGAVITDTAGNDGGDGLTITSTGNLTVSQAVTNNDAGAVVLRADGDVDAAALGDVTSAAGGGVTVSADDNGDNSGALTMADGAVVDAGSGDIDLDSYGDILLGRLVTTSASNTAVTVTSGNGGIVDNGDTGGEDVDAVSGRLVIDTVTGIGSADALETEVASLDLDNTTSGAVQLVETDALEVVNAQQGAAAALSFTLTGTAAAGGDDLTVSDGPNDPDLDSAGTVTIIEGSGDGIALGTATSTNGLTLDNTELGRISAAGGITFQTAGVVDAEGVTQAVSEELNQVALDSTGDAVNFSGASVFDSLDVTASSGITIDDDGAAGTAEIDTDTAGAGGTMVFNSDVTLETGTGDGVVLLTTSAGSTIDFAGTGTALDQNTNGLDVTVEAADLDVSGGGTVDFTGQNLFLYTWNDAVPINLGVAVDSDFGLTDADLGNLAADAGSVIRFGEPGNQEAAVTCTTAQVAGAASEARYELYSDAGSGTARIDLDDGGNTAAAFDTNGGGDVWMFAGAQDLRAVEISNTTPEIQTTGEVILSSASQIGDNGTIYPTEYHPIQFTGGVAGTDGPASINIHGTGDTPAGQGAPDGAWLEGIGGDITVTVLHTEGGTVDIGVTTADDIILNEDIATNGNSVVFRRPVLVNPNGTVAVADTISIDTGGSGAAGDVTFQDTVNPQSAGLDHLQITAYDGASDYGNVIFQGEVGGTDRMGDLTVTDAAAVTLGAPWTGSSLDISHSGTLTLTDADGTGDTANPDVDLSGTFGESGAGSVEIAGDIATAAGTVDFTNPVELTGDLLVDTDSQNTGTGADLSFADASTVGDDGSGPWNLTVDAPAAAVSFGANPGAGNGRIGGAGGADRIGTLTVTDADTVTFNGELFAGALTQTAGGTSTVFEHGVDLTGNADLNGQAFTIKDGLTTTSGGSLTVTNAGTLSVADIDGTGDTGTADLDLDGPFVQDGTGDVSIAGDIDTTGDEISFDRPVTVTGDWRLDSDSANSGTGGLVDFAAAATVDDDTNGPWDVTVRAPAAPVTLGADLGAAEALGQLDITGGTVELTGIGASGAYGLSGTLDVNASVQTTLYGGHYRMDGAADFTGSNTPVILRQTGTSEMAAGGAGFTFYDLYLDFPGVTATLFADVRTHQTVFYRGTLDINGQTLSTDQNGGGDFVVFGGDYDPDDKDWDEDSDADITDDDDVRHAYPEVGGLSYYPAGGGYTGGTGVFDTAPGAAFADLAGSTITVGTGGTGNFYSNGTDMTGTAGWTLNLQDNSSPDPVNNGPWGSPYAAAFNMTVENSEAAGGVVAAAEPEVGPPAETNNNVTDNGGNTNWDFTRPEITSVRTLYDNIIKVVFSEPVENDNDELQSIVGTGGALNNPAYLRLRDGAASGAVRFTGVYTSCADETDDPTNLSYSTGDTDTIYLETAETTWNTDATGSSAGAADSTDRLGAPQTAIPELSILKRLVWDAAGHNALRNYGENTFGAYTGAEDYCRPVLYQIDAGRAPHVSGNPDDYDAHNYFRLYYSEPMNIGSSLTAGDTNIQAQPTFSAAGDRGGHFNDLGDAVDVVGYFQYGSTGNPMDVTTGSRDGDATENSLYRTDSTDAADDHEVVIYLSGHRTLADNDGDGQQDDWRGWHENVTQPPTALSDYVISANSYITDQSAANNNVLDHTANGGNPVAVDVTGVHAGDGYAWDVDPPEFSIYTSGGEDTGSYELVSRDTNDNELIDRFEIHLQDNSSENNDTLWNSSDESGNDPPYEHLDTRSHHGVRDSSLVDADVGGFSFGPSGSLTAAGNTTYGTDTANRLFDDDQEAPYDNNVADDPYFAVNIDDSAVTWNLVKQLYFTYDAAAGQITDLAGNRMASVSTPEACIEKIPPRISYTTAIAGDDKLFVRFSEPISYTDYDGDGVFDDSLLPDVSVSSVEPLTMEDGMVRDVYLHLDSTLTGEMLLEGFLKAGENASPGPDEPDSDIVDRIGVPMDTTVSYAAATVAGGMVDPLWASDGLHDDELHGGTSGALRTFDGSGRLLPRDITLQAQVLEDPTARAQPIQMIFDMDPPSDIIPESDLWLPAHVPGLTEYGNSDARILNPYSTDSNGLRNFLLPDSDEEMSAGKDLQFLFRLGGLYCARPEDPEDPRTLVPWSIPLEDVTRQKGGVTLVNNVINPEEGDRAALIYETDTPGMVAAQVFDLGGDLVRVLHRGAVAAGEHTWYWDGRNSGGRVTARGVYFVRVVGPGVDEMRKIMVVK